MPACLDLHRRLLRQQVLPRYQSLGSLSSAYLQGSLVRGCCLPWTRHTGLVLAPRFCYTKDHRQTRGGVAQLVRARDS
jgi:hypothetical protein